LGNASQAIILNKESIYLMKEIQESELVIFKQAYQQKMKLQEHEAAFLQLEKDKDVCEMTYKYHLKLPKVIRYSYNMRKA
jgi:hypothetical protein